MAAPLSEDRRERVRAWLKQGKSNSQIRAAAQAEGWSISQGAVSGLRQSLGAEAPEPAEHKVVRLLKEQQAERERAQSVDRLDLVAVLRGRLLAAQRVADNPELGPRDQLLASRTVADLAKQLVAAQRAGSDVGTRPQVTFFFPHLVEIQRLEAEC